MKVVKCPKCGKVFRYKEDVNYIEPEMYYECPDCEYCISTQEVDKLPYKRGE